MLVSVSLILFPLFITIMVGEMAEKPLMKVGLMAGLLH